MSSWLSVVSDGSLYEILDCLLVSLTVPGGCGLSMLLIVMVVACLLSNCPSKVVMVQSCIVYSAMSMSMASEYREPSICFRSRIKLR